MVVIRLARYGKKHAPFYQVTVAEHRARLGGRFIERIGDYNPSQKLKGFVLNMDRYNYWLQKGAQPSERVEKMVKELAKAKA